MSTEIDKVLAKLESTAATDLAKAKAWYASDWTYALAVAAFVVGLFIGHKL